MRSLIRWSAWLCLSLMLWTVVAEPTHSHLNRAQSASCSMCILAHSARPASSNQASPVFRAVAVLPEARFSPRFGLRALRWSSAVLLLSTDSQSTYSGADAGPPRIVSRYLFDLAIGNDNLFHGDKYKVSGQLTVINLTNKYALYNFLSTFSGTHYVTPRAITAQLAFHF